MQFNPGDGSGVVDEVLDLADADLTSYPLTKIVRRCNTAIETLVAELLNASGTWQFDDSNYDNLPIGTTTLVDGQQQVTFSNEFLSVENVMILDIGGKWQPLNPVDQRQRGYPLENLTQATLPYLYDKEGPILTLYPPVSALAVTLANGLKVKFKRTAVLFTIADTTMQPGFASPYHILVAQMAALPYCKTYKPDKVPQLVVDIREGKASMIKFYSAREQDIHANINTKKVSGR